MKWQYLMLYLYFASQRRNGTSKRIKNIIAFYCTSFKLNDFGENNKQKTSKKTIIIDRTVNYVHTHLFTLIPVSMFLIVFFVVCCRLRYFPVYFHNFFFKWTNKWTKSIKKIEKSTSIQQTHEIQQLDAWIK